MKKIMEKREYESMFNLEKYDWWVTSLRLLVFSFITGLPLAANKIKILDAGCGTGGFLDMLSSLSWQYCGIEISDGAIKFCKIRGITNIIKERNSLLSSFQRWVI